MTTNAQERNIPALTLGWRLQMSLQHGNVTVQEMADALNLSRTSLSRWLNDRGSRRPNRLFLEKWAELTGVPLAWLEHGVTAADPDDTPRLPGETEAERQLRISKQRRRRGPESFDRYLADAEPVAA